ncbi:citrate lyase subunit alpha, partial [Klebsiella pneumoniae]
KDSSVQPAHPFFTLQIAASYR